ncbi:MAG: M16 family metallopeptidase [Syntrophobacteraceae bacterium]
MKGKRLYNKTVLDNGIRVVTEKIPHVYSVATGIWLSVGSRDEQAGERGITHFIEHMLFKGTPRRNALEIAKELDSVGGFANAFTSKEHVCIHAKVLERHLPLVVDVLTDIFINSVFDPEEIEKEQQVILQEIRMIEDTPDEFVHVLFQEMFWPDNPLGLPIYGGLDSVVGLKRDNVLRYFSRFAPDRIVISAAGNIDHDRFVELVAKPMKTWSHSGNSFSRKTPGSSHQVRIIKKDLELVHLCLGMQGASQVDEMRFPCYLMNTILGSSMSSRLFQEIREKRGLAYSVYSFANSHEDTGMLGIYAGVTAENIKETLKIVYEQLLLLAEKPISEAELASAKEQLKGSMYLNAESTDSRMNRLAKNEFLFGRYVPFEESEEKINKVTPQEIQSWFRNIFEPGRLALMLFGPVDLEVSEVEKLIGKS